MPYLLMLVVFFVSCCGRRSDPIDKIPNPSDKQAHYEERLIEFLKDGWVVTRNPDGSNHDEGDSLLFTGLALGSLSCDSVARYGLLNSFERMIDNYDGYLVRIDPLTEEYVNRDDYVSRDGATGALYGLLRHSQRCSENRERVKRIMDQWHDTVGSAVLLHPKSKAVKMPSFSAFWRVAHGRKINDLEYAVYMTSTIFTAKTIQLQRRAAVAEGNPEKNPSCYPVNLQTLQHIIMEMQGQAIYERDKSAWCDITKDFGLLLSDWYCARNDDKIQDWLENPQQSRAVYMHQRCSWETEGFHLSPRVDYLLLNSLRKEGSSWQLVFKNLRK